MKEITISEFRTRCYAILERVRKTRQRVRVTRYGKPLAEIGPPTLRKSRRLGRMVGTGRITSDIVGPTGSLDEWGGDAENVFSPKN